jgi:serine protease Do
MTQGRPFNRRNLLRQGLAFSASALTWSAAAQQSEAVRKLELARIDVITKARKTVISVYVKGGNGGGSGVVISADGYALTNYHVYRPCGDFMKCAMNDGKLYDALIVGLDPTGDIALIKLFGRTDFSSAILGESDKVRVGDGCFAIGDPFTLATNFQHTVTSGIVSGIHRQQPKYQGEALLEYCDAIQTDASINPGNSGGPLFNEKGEVIGINGLIYSEKRRGVNAGVGYAISSNQIKNFLGILRGGRIVDHASLGAVAATNSDVQAEVINLTANAEVSRRGLMSGDIIEKVAGRTIRSANDLKNAIFILPEGWRVPVEYRRKGESLSMLARLPGMHRDGELEEIVEKEMRAPQGPPGAPSTKRDMPKEYAKFFRKKRGFANYHFNEVERDRVLTALKKQLPNADINAIWQLEGDTSKGKFRAELGEKTSNLEFLGRKHNFAADTEISSQLLPRETGGLLPALHLWRRIHVYAPASYGAVEYWGTAPWPAATGLCDVLSAISKDEELRVFVEPTKGRLIGLELWISPDEDPGEIAFFHDEEGALRQLIVSLAGRIFAEIRVTALRMEAAP